MKTIKYLFALTILMVASFSTEAYHRVCFPTGEALAQNYEAKNGLLYMVKTPETSTGKLNIQMPVVDQGNFEGGVNLVCPIRNNIHATGEKSFINAPELYIGAAWTGVTTSISNMVSCDLVVRAGGEDVYRQGLQLIPLTNEFSREKSTSHNVEKRNSWIPEGFNEKAYLQSYGTRVTDTNYIDVVRENDSPSSFFECDVSPNFDVATSIMINVSAPTVTVVN
tara:strand:- start:124935 stop:125603 length:669 start_codon:yes stop_codon:yes gene_type:complete